MDDLSKHIGPASAIVGAIFWLARLEYTAKGNRSGLAALRVEMQEENAKLRRDLEALQREHAEIIKQMHGQAIMMARIEESLSSIKLTLDRIYDRTAGKVA